MNKHTTKIWIVIASLCMLVMGAACSPIAVSRGEAVNGTPEITLIAGDEETGGTSLEYVQELRGTVTEIVLGADGIQVELESGDAVYSVTISIIQAQEFGRMEQIQQQSEIVVSGPIIKGTEPPLVVAERVTVLGSDPDYVLNLQGTVIDIEMGTDGITAEIEAADGSIYSAAISLVTTEIVYLGTEKEIQVGTPLWISGELFDLDGAHIAADRVVANPPPAAGSIEVYPTPLAN